MYIHIFRHLRSPFVDPVVQKKLEIGTLVHPDGTPGVPG